MHKFTLGTAVLAGGRSSRMGQNKVLMEYQNRRFLDRICEELQGFDEKPCISAAMPGEYELLSYPAFFNFIFDCSVGAILMVS